METQTQILSLLCLPLSTGGPQASRVTSRPLQMLFPPPGMFSAASLSLPPTWNLFLLQGIVNSLCCNSQVWSAVSLGEHVLTMHNLCALLSYTKPSGLLAHCTHDAVQTLDSRQELYLQGTHGLLDKQTAVKYKNEPDYCCPPLTGHGLCYEKERVDCQSIRLPGRMGLCPNHTFALLSYFSSVLTVFPPSWSVLRCPNARASYFFLL